MFFQLKMVIFILPEGSFPDMVANFSNKVSHKAVLDMSWDRFNHQLVVSTKYK